MYCASPPHSSGNTDFTVSPLLRSPERLGLPHDKSGTMNSARRRAAQGAPPGATSAGRLAHIDPAPPRLSATSRTRNGRPPWTLDVDPLPLLRGSPAMLLGTRRGQTTRDSVRCFTANARMLASESSLFDRCRPEDGRPAGTMSRAVRGCQETGLRTTRPGRCYWRNAGGARCEHIGTLIAVRPRACDKIQCGRKSALGD